MVDTSFLDTLYPRAPSLATQFTLYPRAPSPPEDLLPQGTFSSRGPSLAWRRFTLSCCAIHLVSPGGDSPCTPGHPLLPDGNSPCTPGHPLPQGTLSCCAIHLVLPYGNSPCKYIPVRSTAASLGNCSCTPSKGPTLWCSTFAHPWARAADGPSSLCRPTCVLLSMLRC